MRRRELDRGRSSSVHMISGGEWTMSAGDMLIVLAVTSAVRRDREVDRASAPVAVLDHGPVATAVPRHDRRVPAGGAGRDLDLLSCSWRSASSMCWAASRRRCATRRSAISPSKDAPARFVLNAPLVESMNRDFQLPGRSPVIACEGHGGRPRIRSQPSAAVDMLRDGGMRPTPRSPPAPPCAWSNRT